MMLTITLGWWLAPLLITIASFLLAYLLIPAPQPRGFFPDIGPAILGAFYMAGALVLSLVTWLVWALIA